MHTAHIWRFHDSEHDTVGLLTLDGVFLCFVLEDEYRATKVSGETRIPAGTYTLALEYSPKFSPRPTYGHDMLTVKDVPGFSGIRIHIGNVDKDTEGCPLLGNQVIISYGGPSRLVESGVAYNRVYPILAEAVKEGCKIVVGDLPSGEVSKVPILGTIG